MPYRNTEYYNKAKDKFMNDMDIMNIVSNLNKVQVLVDTLFDRHQKELMNFSKNHTVLDGASYK